MAHIHSFTTRRGIHAAVIGDRAHGDRFGFPLDGAEVLRLFRRFGDDLPFDIMAAGYGEDEDWVGLDSGDILDWPEHTAASIEAEWGPFEVWDAQHVLSSRHCPACEDARRTGGTKRRMSCVESILNLRDELPDHPVSTIVDHHAAVCPHCVAWL
jgi:hypothetical protein